MDVLGNEANQEMLFRAVQADRLHHALLFHGPAGVGKRRMAFRLAMYRTCPQRLEGAGDCHGRCPSCSRMLKHYDHLQQPDHEQGTMRQFHPDLIYLEPPEKESGVITIGNKSKKPEEWAGSIRWLIQQLHLKPNEAIGHSVIIDCPERIQHEAMHTLLKTLEEPPPGCLIILVTSQPDALLATYRSRCQAVRFRCFHRERLEEILREHYDHSAEDARLLAGVARGSLGRALNLDMKSWLEKRGLALEMVETASRTGWAARQTLMEMAAGISRSKKQWDLVGREIPELLGCLLRDLLRIRSGLPGAQLTSPDLADELRLISGRLTTIDPGMAYRLAEDVKQGLKRNLNRRLVCETMLINMRRTFGTEILSA